MIDVSPTQARLVTLHRIFRPSSPTHDANLFRGRRREIEKVLDAASQDGRHVIVYGERGVGKTSLSYIVREMFQQTRPAIAVRVQCSQGDSFGSVWTTFARELRRATRTLDEATQRSLEAAVHEVELALEYPDPSGPGPREVAAAVEKLSHQVPLMIIIDEFDRLQGGDPTIPFSDLIKQLSDGLVPATLVLIGVADDITQLLDGHQSLSRNLLQVAMPRMSVGELAAIVLGGYSAYSEIMGEKLQCDRDTAQAIARISDGFPYYTHLLAGAAGAVAIRAGNDSITRRTVFGALVHAVDDADHAIRSNYTAAVTGRADARIGPTLLACALAGADDLGLFSSTDVARALSAVLGEPRNAGHVNNHLRRFASEGIDVLEERRLGERRIRYRFRDPMMKPFVVIKGLEDQLIPETF